MSSKTLFETARYQITVMEESDIPQIAAIYNSNRDFLKSHVGAESISDHWAIHEYQETRESGFSSCKIVGKESGLPVGFLEFQVSDETYLSLMMVNKQQSNSGIGTEVLQGFEQYAKTQNSERIRIDVVTGYHEAVMRFWLHNGFLPEQEITVSWNEKRLQALKMIKIV